MALYLRRTAHTRSEVRRKKGRDNLVAEIKKAYKLGVLRRACRLTGEVRF
jgi:uncharacterized protein (UPF0297 family)